MENVAVGALATICAAFLGAVATIVAALISKRRADNRQQDEQIHHIAEQAHSSLIKGNIKEYSLLEIKENSVIIVPDIELTLAIHDVILDDQINFEYHLPRQEKDNTESVKYARVGYQKLFNCDNSAYLLTLIKIDGVNKKTYFDLRKIDSRIQQKMPVTASQNKSHDTQDSKNQLESGISAPNYCIKCGAVIPQETIKCSYCGTTY